MANVSAASFSQMGLLLVLICWTTGSTGDAFISKEEFLQLKENYIQMKEIVKSLESKVTELEWKEVQMQEKEAKLDEKVTQLEAKNTQLETKVQEQDLLLTSLLHEKNERISAVNSDFTPINQSAVAISGLPSSCSDLKMIGHIWSGIYSIMGSTTIESVYCDFTKLPSDAGFQKWIGYVDIKSATVHFYVQRNSGFETQDTPIPFDLARVNEGNAMNLTTGIFMAPRKGIYFFSFTGYVEYSSSSTLPYLYVGNYLNGQQIGTGFVYVELIPRGPEIAIGIPLTLQWTLSLKPGDQVWLEIDEIDTTQLRVSYFTGFMLDEDIVASL